MATPSYITYLKTRRDNITTELAAIDNNASRTNPGSKPDSSGEGGGTEGDSYVDRLYRELAQIEEALRDAAQTAAAEDRLANGHSEIEVVME